VRMNILRALMRVCETIGSEMRVSGVSLLVMVANGEAAVVGIQDAFRCRMNTLESRAGWQSIRVAARPRCSSGDMTIYI